MINFCEQFNITVEQFYGKEKIIGSLDLSSLTALPEGFNPVVGGYLDLRSVTALPEGFNPIIGSSLYLNSVTALPEGFNPTVGDSLYLNSVTALPKGFNPTVGGYLDLSSVTTIPERFNPTVGDSLFLDSVTDLPKGFNPTVGGYLDLRSLTVLPEGFDPTVGGYLYLKGKEIQLKNLPKDYMFSWENGKYIKVDGIFTEVISKKGKVWKVKKLNSDKEFYLVTDGEKYAHGDTIKEAKRDLIFKIGNRTKDDYKDLNLNSVLSLEEGIICYRVLTGACSFGVKDFMINRMKTKKKKYKVSEIIEMTETEYGGKDFKNFFLK